MKLPQNPHFIRNNRSGNVGLVLEFFRIDGIDRTFALVKTNTGRITRWECIEGISDAEYNQILQCGCY